MRRVSGVLLGLVLVGAVVVAGGAAQAVLTVPSHFEIGIVAGEGPPPVAGSSFSFSATLVDEGQEPVAGVPVTLSARPYGSSTFITVAQAVTDDAGYARAEAVLRRTSVVRWSYAGNVEHGATTSAAYVTFVGSPVTAHATDATLRRQQQLVVVGRTAPSKAGSRVSLWRGDKPAFAPGLEMTRVAVGLVRSDGTFRLTTRFPHTGTKRLYVKVNAGHGNAEGYSKYLVVRVR
ncbi:MAG: hypothetical protein NTV23_07990 [Propionibacteriales bacterium]|nr:hypothetical protein [Propionibacteriales bacterium]